VKLEQVEALVDGVDQSDVTGQVVNGPDAAVNEAARSVGDVITNVGGGEGGFAAVAESLVVEASLNPALVAGQLLSYGNFHSKSSGNRGVGMDCYSSNTAETPTDFEFFRKSRRQSLTASLG